MDHGEKGNQTSYTLRHRGLSDIVCMDNMFTGQLSHGNVPQDS